MPSSRGCRPIVTRGASTLTFVPSGMSSDTTGTGRDRSARTHSAVRRAGAADLSRTEYCIVSPARKTTALCSPRRGLKRSYAININVYQASRTREGSPGSIHRAKPTLSIRSAALPLRASAQSARDLGAGATEGREGDSRRPLLFPDWLLLLLAQALLQRRHQVDDLGPLRRPLVDQREARLLARSLGTDELFERLRITVVEGLGLERLRLPLDQLLG